MIIRIFFFISSHRICQRVRLNIIFKTFIHRIDRQRDGQSSVNDRQYGNPHMFWVFSHLNHFFSSNSSWKAFRLQPQTHMLRCIRQLVWMCAAFWKTTNFGSLWNKCIYPPEHFGYCILLIIYLLLLSFGSGEEKDALGPIETCIQMLKHKWFFVTGGCLAGCEVTEWLYNVYTVIKIYVFYIICTFHMAQNHRISNEWLWDDSTFDIRHIPIETKWQTTCHTILPQS